MPKGEKRVELKERLAKERVGLINCNKQGEKMKIIEYNSAINIIIEFEDGHKVKSRYEHFSIGNINNPYFPSICSVGYLGEGIYKTKTNNKITKVYDYWRSMLKRCYDEKELIRFPTYKGCSVCDEWHNFQNFAIWLEENYYNVNDEVMCLDKDILFKSNKIYSPETCVFVPERVNTLFIKSNATRGDYPIGVTYDKRSSVFISKYNVLNERKYIGTYNTAEKAFYAYKYYKEKYIKQIADEYKELIPQKLYEAMYNWKVEITD